MNNESKEIKEGKTQDQDNTKTVTSKPGKKKNKGKGGKPGGKPGNPKDKGGSDQKSFRPSTKQDPLFYAPDAMALKDMASFPWNYVLGQPVSLNVRADCSAAPGIMRIKYIPAIGYQGLSVLDMPAAGNNYPTRAARTFFNYFTQGFTSGVDFQSSDIMIATICAANLCAFMELGRRVYGVTKFKATLNAYYPRALIEALGFDYDDLIANLANFRMEFNIRARQISQSMAVPESLPILKKWIWDNSMIFCDSNDVVHSQLYFFTPEKYFEYSATAMPTGTCAKLSRVDGDRVTVGTFFKMIDIMINALDDDDTRAMFGALKRVYSDAQLYKIPELEESYVTNIYHHETALMAIHNMTWLGDAEVEYSTGDIAQVGGGKIAIYQTAEGMIQSRPGIAKMEYSKYHMNLITTNNRHMLDLFDYQTSPDAVVDVTAMICSVNTELAGDGTNHHPISCRCEIPTHVSVVYNNNNGQSTELAIPQCYDKDNIAVYNILYSLNLFTAFNYMPFLYVKNVTSDNIENYFGELDNVQLVNARDMFMLHERTFAQLLNIVPNAKSVT